MAINLLGTAIGRQYSQSDLDGSISSSGTSFETINTSVSSTLNCFGTDITAYTECLFHVTSDGIYEFHYKFAKDSPGPNIGGFVRTIYWRYVRQGLTRQMYVRTSPSDPWDPTGEQEDVNQDFTLTSIYDVLNYFQFIESSLGTADFRAEAPGTWTIEEKRYHDVSGTMVLDSTRIVGDFEIRVLALDIFIDPPVFDPRSDRNTTTLIGVVYALPAQTWTPDSPVDWRVRVTPPEETVFGLAVFEQDGTEAVSSPDPDGVVATFFQDWDGIPNGFPQPVEGTFDFSGIVIADDSPSPGNTGTGIWYSQILSNCCRCQESVYGTTIKGCQTSGTLLHAGGNPVGPSMDVVVRYDNFQSDQLPASLGFGWSSQSSVRLLEQTNGDLVYKNEAGSYQRWRLDSGNYIPLTADNYIEAEKDAMNPNYTFALTFKDQSRREFDSDGYLLRDLDRNDNTVEYSYDGSMRLLEVNDGNGRALYYDYGGRTDGQPESIRVNDPMTGRQIQFEYYSAMDPDVPDRLWKTISPEGEVTEYLYYTDGKLAVVIDPRGLWAEFYSYDYLGRKVVENRYDQVQIEYTYPFDLSAVQIDRYDLSGDPDPTQTSIHYYDLFSNIVLTVDLVDDSDPMDVIVNQTFQDYQDPLNPYLMTRLTQPNGAETNFTYNAQGNLSAQEDAQGNVSTFEYADDIDTPPINPKHRNLLRKAYRPTVTVNGTPVNYDPTEFQYDSNGNLVKIIDAKGEETDMVVDSAGLVTDLTNRLGQTTVMAYFANNNLQTITTPSGPNSAPTRTTTFGYDDYDNVTSVTDPLSNVWSTVYDGQDRVIQRTDALSKVTNFSFVDGLLEYVEAPANQASDPDPRKTYFSYDDPGRVIQVDVDISSVAQLNRVNYEFTGFSTLRKQIRKIGLVEAVNTYNYDRLSRLILSTDPLDRETAVAHAPFCTEYTVTTERGVVRTYSRNNLCLLTGVDMTDETKTYEYDELRRLVRIVQDENETTPYSEEWTLEYDELDRLVRMNFPNSLSMEWDWDKESNLVKLTDVHGHVTEYTYYNDNRLYQVIIKRPLQSDRIFTYSYDAAGRLLEIEYPSGTNLVARFTNSLDTPGSGWDANGNLLHLRYLQSSTLLQGFAYAYDDSGNRIQLVDTPSNPLNAVTWDYGYDWINRLTSVDRNTVTHSVYSYDDRDNRLSWDQPVATDLNEYSYDLADQIQDRSLNSTVVETFTHDDDGNMISRTLVAGPDTTNYRRNDDDRLTRIQLPTTAEEVYRYDADGIRKYTDNTTSYFSSGGTSVAETNASGDVSYIQGHVLLGLDLAGTFYYYLTDGLSSVRLVVNASGSEVASFLHNEFGILETATGSSTLRAHTYVGGAGVRNETGFSGLHYMRQRWYEPTLGRFLRQDPIGFDGGLNLYTYVGNDPVNRVDPSGLESPPRGGYEGGMPDPFGRTPAEYRWDALDGTVMIGLGAGAAYEAWLLVAPAGEYLFARWQMRGGPQSTQCPPASASPSPWNQARRGDSVHYDELNGRPGTKSGPSAFQRKYPQTVADHTPQGKKGVDLTITGGKHPSTYPGSNWPPKANTADFKPGNKGGYDAFRRESKSGKIPPNTVMMPYNPETLDPYIP